MSSYTDTLTKRNKIILLLETLTLHARFACLSSNIFQAGLDALDPDAPCWVQDGAIQDVIYRGLKAMMRDAAEGKDV